MASRRVHSAFRCLVGRHSCRMVGWTNSGRNVQSLSKVCPNFVQSLSNLCPCPRFVSALSIQFEKSLVFVQYLSMISPMYVHSLSIPYSFVQQRIYWTKPGQKIVQGLSRLCPSLSAQCQLKVKCPYFVQALSMSKVCPDKNVLDKSMSKLCPYFVQTKLSS